MLFNVVLDTYILCFLSLCQAVLREHDPCSSNPCENGSTCDSQQNMYTCACAQGWTGTRCEKKQNRDEKHISRRSVSTTSSYFCDSEWILNRTSCYYIGKEYITATAASTKCEDLNSYIVEVNDEEENALLSQQASNLGRSLWIGLTDRSIENIWRWTSSGTVAEFTSWGDNEPNNMDVEDCALYSSSHEYNWNDLACTETAGYICEKNANDVDECSSGDHTCSVNANCENTEGGFICSCKTGFSGDGADCTDVDECSSGGHTCSVNADCENTEGGFTCSCKTGFSGDGTDCIDVDECSSWGHNCSENADCENTEGGFTCSCKTGFSGDGVDCTDIDECGSDPCLNGATCHDSVNSYTCGCEDRFTGSHCEIGDNIVGCYRWTEGGTIKNDFDVWEASILTVVGREALLRDPFKEKNMCQPHFPAEADVIFLVDISLSQSFIHVEKQKNFVKDFVSKFPIGRASFQISLVTSSLEANVHFYLNNLTSEASIKEAVDEIVNEEGPTYTGKGLQKIRESVLQSHNGARMDVNTFVFVLTDGLSSQVRDTKYQADKLKSLGVEVITVAVGRQMNHKELINIASHSTRVFPVSSDDAVNVVYKAHVMDECPKCFHRTADVAIMVDASNELSVVKYYKQIDALVLLLRNMPVDVEDVHVSCSQYAQDVVDEFQLTDYMTSSDIVVKMNKLGQLLSSSANVSRALEYLRKFSFLNSSGARDATRKIALLVINADFNEENVKDMTDEADRLKDSGVILVIITIGISDSLTTLLSMASDPAFTFVLGDDTNVGYDALFALLGSLDFDTCNMD